MIYRLLIGCGLKDVFLVELPQVFKVISVRFFQFQTKTIIQVEINVKNRVFTQKSFYKQNVNVSDRFFNRKLLKNTVFYSTF